MARSTTAHPLSKVPNFEIPDDVTEVAKAYLELKEQKKCLEADVERLQEELLKYTGNSFQASHNGVTIRSYTVKDSTTVDSKKLQKDFPDAYKACSKPKSGHTRLEVSIAAQPAETQDQLQQLAA